MFAEHGFDRLGSTLLEVSKLNNQMYFVWLRALKNAKRAHAQPQEARSPDETRNWKAYALELETNLKQIHEFRINSHLKTDLSNKLDIYDLESSA